MTTASSSPTATRRPLSMPRQSGQILAPLSRQCLGLQSRRQEVTADLRGSSTPFPGSCRWAPLSLTPRRWTTPAVAPPVPWAPGRCQWQWCRNAWGHWSNVTLWHITHSTRLPLFVSPGWLFTWLQDIRRLIRSYFRLGREQSRLLASPGTGSASRSEEVHHSQQKSTKNKKQPNSSHQKFPDISTADQQAESFFPQRELGLPKYLCRQQQGSVPGELPPTNKSQRVLTCFKFQASKFVTSTPVKSVPWPQVSRRRAGNIRNVFPPPVTSGAPMSAQAKGNNIMTCMLSCVVMVSCNNFIRYNNTISCPPQGPELAIFMSREITYYDTGGPWCRPLFDQPEFTSQVPNPKFRT